MSHHYAFVAARLVEQCLEQIQCVIDTDERQSFSSAKRLHAANASLYDMKEALTEIERHLHCYFVYIIQKEVEDSTSSQVHEEFEGSNPFCDLSACVSFLRSLLQEASLSAVQQPGHRAHSYYPRRSATDSLLFRLNVALQLCLVRIDDARLVICGRRLNKQLTTTGITVVMRATKQIKSSSPLLHVAAGMLGATSLTLLYLHRDPSLKAVRHGLAMVRHHSLLRGAIGTCLGLGVTSWLHQTWSTMWMTNKIVKSTEALEEWSRQWTLVQCTPTPATHQQAFQPKAHAQSVPETEKCQDSLIDAARSQRLIEYALHETTKTSFWHSQGELRFLMLKRAMDVFYASVGTAMDLTGTSSDANSAENDAANWQLQLVTAAVASFYSVTGARDKAAAVTSSSASARNLIQNAWGMVSLPAVKNLSLQASRLLKGAAVADRIEICGVHCFVLSSDPVPELAAAIKRNRRLHQRRKPIATLSTIDEQEEHTPSNTNRSSKPFVQSSSRRHRQRDVIFHLTGGGFFAHIHSTDLPYLLDWSAATGAVVICPEYALLPEHTFPVALRQVEEIYHALVSNDAVSVLGFETNRIVVTGESAGGNLAASLCVMLSMDRRGTESDHRPEVVDVGTVHASVTTDEKSPTKQHCFNVDASPYKIRLPDALMLSCPVLDLSLEMSHSRVVGTEDPVLPSGLISAISDAYLPKRLGVSKKDPLASPFYASDAVLQHFPPTLLFASSNDPLLDDSVVFNQRLRGHGVDSDLIAAHNLPHAYLGLGTAGFPEALQVQEQCVNWLTFQLTKDGNE